MCIPLSKRLTSVAYYLPKGAYFADIGSDHAYLACYVCLHDDQARAVAGDINVGPYLSAQTTVAKYNLQDVIDVRLGDGLSVLGDEKITELVIAGMGGLMIKTILDEGKEKLHSIKRIIAQPNTDEPEVRKWFMDNGFTIKHESILEENDHIYEMIVADRHDHHVVLSNQELYFGPQLLKRKPQTFIKKLHIEKIKYEHILNQLRGQTNDHDTINRFEKKLIWIKEVLQMEGIKNADIFAILDQWAPQNLAFEWDNIGLQVGSSTEYTNKIMITLDVLESVVDEAIQQDVNLIISHHPLLFKSLNQIDLSTPKGRTIQKLIEHNITVYTAHTNLDIASGGVNDLLAEQLQIQNCTPLVDLGTENQYKVIVYVPTTHIEEMSEAFHKGGAGQIGDYSHCTFHTEGQGRFKPLKGSDPFIGNPNEVAHVDEVKMESIVPEDVLATVISEIKQAHPYEEVAYDVLLLENSGEAYGLGRIGELERSMSLQQLCDHVKESLNLEKLRVTGELTNTVKKVAILGGSGEKFIFDAINKNADVYITGDMTFHLAQEAMEMGLAVIDAGHYIEKIMKQATQSYLKNTHLHPDVEIVCSQVNTNPFQFR